jgi:aspartyl-tRNA(Asn)/glutamyl-tRNA(Gln) amidotransferase subunit A
MGAGFARRSSLPASARKDNARGITFQPLSRVLEAEFVPTNDLTSLSLSEASNLVQNREVSPVELVDACISRSEALDPKLHAYLTQTFEPAREEAEQAAAELAAGKARGPLHGIPFALKDLYETAGVRTTAGSKLREDYVPEQDAQVVTLLKQAGVVQLGKLNMHEWALGATNINRYFPSPRNPWDSERITGGSSGGSGVAIATGMCLGTLGSDTGGSIRIPASLCGITGLKPTFGRVSLRGVVPLSWSLDHSGPMARSALDCALILQAIAGFDPLDAGSVDRGVNDYSGGIDGGVRGLRVGVPANFFFDEDAVDAGVAATVREAVKVLEGLGATLSTVEVPDIVRGARANGTILLADAAAYHEETIRDHPDEIQETVLGRLQNGANVSGPVYARARRTQSEFKAALHRLYQDIDLLVAPTTPVVAQPFPAGDNVATTGALTRHTGLFNVAGLPSISVPCGFSADRLPIGMMLTGRPWEEALVLRAAHAYQQATDWHVRRPAV